MSNLPVYSPLFSCLYDEPAPVGRLGRGTHYSICRSVEWLDVQRKPLAKPQIHDFAIIWDEDHDERIIEAIEEIYMAGLLSPIQFIGERKGSLTAILAARYYSWNVGTPEFDQYTRQIYDICQGLDDPWVSQIGTFDRSPGSPHQYDPAGIINDDERKIEMYLRNTDSLWNLGTKTYDPNGGGPQYPRFT